MSGADTAPRAILSRDGASFLMTRGPWRSSWIPIEKLPYWRKLYTDIAARKGGAFERFYAPWFPVLDALAKKISEQNQ